MAKTIKILLIGQCTLHWGRMEYGNIGNYYIIEPFIRELHRTFKDCVVRTTFQMSERFCHDENVEVLPMSYYYGFEKDDLEKAKNELEIATKFSSTGNIEETTPFIDAVLDSDLIIDFSGDIWGDNADFLGDNRFLVGLIKDRVAQLFGKKTAMIAGSPGPFSNKGNLKFAKEVYRNFDLITNREAFSRRILEEVGMDLSKTYELSCPAFLFEPAKDIEIEKLDSRLVKAHPEKILGVIICGWNFVKEPFDKWPRESQEYDFIVNPLKKFLESNKDVKACLLSHSNGFIPGKTPFQLLHGRDYPIMKQLEMILLEDTVLEGRVFCMDGIYDPWTTKAIIGSFDMLVSGRVHGAVAGMSQLVSTVILDYGHAPKAHKLKGFANEAGMLQYVANPEDQNDILRKINECWEKRDKIKHELSKNIPLVKDKARKNFRLLKSLVE